MGGKNHVEKTSKTVEFCGHHLPFPLSTSVGFTRYTQKTLRSPQLSTRYPQLGVKNGKKDISTELGSYRACCLIRLVSSVTWL